MYWENYEDQRLVGSKEKERVARKEHKCCECRKSIKKGEKYSYFSGVWDEGWSRSFANAYKTCLECGKDWDEILQVFHDNGEDAFRVFGLLKEAVWGAYDLGLLAETDQFILIKKWLDIELDELDIDVEDLSLEKREEYERYKREEEIAYLKRCNFPLL